MSFKTTSFLGTCFLFPQQSCVTQVVLKISLDKLNPLPTSILADVLRIFFCNSMWIYTHCSKPSIFNDFKAISLRYVLGSSLLLQEAVLIKTVAWWMWRDIIRQLTRGRPWLLSRLQGEQWQQRRLTEEFTSQEEQVQCLQSIVTFKLVYVPFIQSINLAGGQIKREKTVSTSSIVGHCDLRILRFVALRYFVCKRSFFTT